MRVKFTFSKKEELKKLLDLRSKYQWFLDNDFPICMPSFYKALYLKHKDNIGAFEKELKSRLDFNQEIYKEKQLIIEKKWKSVEKEYFRTLEELGFSLLKKYVCVLSLYGPEGRFHDPNTINVRIATKRDIENMNLTIAHEIIHLAIMDYVDKLKFGYEETEGVVDLFFKETSLVDVFPEYRLQDGIKHSKSNLNKVLSLAKDQKKQP